MYVRPSGTGESSLAAACSFEVSEESFDWCSTSVAYPRSPASIPPFDNGSFATSESMNFMYSSHSDGVMLPDMSRAMYSSDGPSVPQCGVGVITVDELDEDEEELEDEDSEDEDDDEDEEGIDEDDESLPEPLPEPLPELDEDEDEDELDVGPPVM